MQLAELTDPELVFADLDGRDGEAVLQEMARRLGDLGRVRKPDLLYDRLREREALGSTALGEGVAVPHCRLPGLSKLLLAIGVSRRGVEFGADDGRPVKLFFLMISPNNAAAEHLQCLAAISKWVKTGRASRLLELRDPHAIYRLLGETAPTDA